ncbi:MAG: 30S ribosomal protein S4 [Candidatus Paceibacterota bacterium]
MKLGPKYKIARRLGAPVFEKTQTQKFVLRSEKKRPKKFTKPKSEFGIQLNEKQKARFTYVLTEKQFSNYVKEALAKKSNNSAQIIFSFLELRLDNVVSRMGFSPTRLGSRQMVSHGHIMVNGKRATTPSRRLKIGDVISIRPESLDKPLFSGLDERIKNTTVPSWIKSDFNNKKAEIVGIPQLAGTDVMFDLTSVIEFYSR